MEMFVRQGQMGFVYAVKSGEDGFTHSVERVLQRFAVVLGECFEQCLAYSVPNWTEFDFVSFVKPVRLDRARKDAIAIFFQGGVRVAQKALEGRFFRLQHVEVSDAGANHDSFAGPTQSSNALSLS